MHVDDPIGVFDSGMGGVSVVHSIHQLMPNENILFLGDSKYNPYGLKSKEEITERCIKICDYFIQQHVKAIVIACNTATSACVPLLREKYDVDIIGMEPALKVACEQGNHQKIAVWATPFTLKEKKFSHLMKRFEDEHDIYKVPCPKLVQIVEEDELDNDIIVNAALEEYISQAQDVNSIVLGCTHFIFYKNLLKNKVSDSVHIVDGNEGTANHLKDLLAEKDLLRKEGPSLIQWENTLSEKANLSKRLFQKLEEEYE